MTNIIDRGSQPLSAYLNKIITVLVKKAGGELRISALDMFEVLDGEGFLKHYDAASRELVLRSAPLGSELFFIRGGDVWASASRSDRISPQSSSADRLLNSPSDSFQTPHRPQRVILDDERLAEIEQQRERDRLARQAEEVLLDFPENPQTVRSYQRPQPTSSQQPQQPQSPQRRAVPDQFYRR